MSSPASTEQPPLKKRRVHSQQPSDTSLVFSLGSSLKSSQNEDYHSVIVKKGDKVQKRITLLEKHLEGDGSVLVMSQGDGIQKMLTITEIVKSKLKDSGYEQFNKLDKYETVVRKNELVDKKVQVPVFYTLIRKCNANVADLKEWTRQDV